MAIQLKHFLLDAGIDEGQTLVMRHTPTQRKVRAALGSWAAERPQMFNAYQSSHLPRQEEMLVRAKRLVSCIGNEPEHALFVGVYEVRGHKPVSDEEYWAIPENQELRNLDASFRSSTLWFDLHLMHELNEWGGKIVLMWPPPDRAWSRWADRNSFPIQAIHPESVLIPPMPGWRVLTLDWAELRVLPRSWADALSQWRGVYLIHDTSDSQCYVGSAYGEQNIYGRWLDYAAAGDGGNRKMRERDPNNFVFSILERLSPDLPSDEVVAVENTWKMRLRTRDTGLNIN